MINHDNYGDFVDSDSTIQPYTPQPKGHTVDPDTDATGTVNVDKKLDVDGDIATVLANLKGLITVGSMSLKDLALLANQSESARAYEVLSTTIKTLSDVNKDILDVHKRKAEMTAIEAKRQGVSVDGVTNQTNVQNNTYFVGTPAELNRMLNAAREEKNDLKEK